MICIHMYDTTIRNEFGGWNPSYLRTDIISEHLKNLFELMVWLMVYSTCIYIDKMDISKMSDSDLAEIYSVTDSLDLQLLTVSSIYKYN